MAPGSANQPEASGQIPLAELVMRRRREMALSQGEVAKLMQKAAKEAGGSCPANRQAVSEYEHGRIPYPCTLRLLASALGVSLEEAQTAADHQRAHRQMLRAAETILGDSAGSGWPPEPSTKGASIPGANRDAAGGCQRAQIVIAFPDSGYPWLASSNDATLGALDMLVVAIPTLEGGVTTVRISRRDLLKTLGVGAVCAPFLHRLGHVPVGDETVTQLEGALDGYMSAARVVAPGRLIDPLVGQVGVINALQRSASTARRPRLMATQARYAEFLSWMHEEHGDLASAVWWIDRSTDWAEAAGWPSMVAFGLVRKSVIATMHMADGPRTIEWAERAMHHPGATAGVSGFAAAQLAYGHALNGNLQAASRAIDVAAGHYRQAAQRSVDETPIGARSVLDADLNWATCNLFAGRGDAALVLLAPRMQAVEGASRRAYAIHAARLAHAHALAGDREEACRSAVAALEATDIVESATARSELKRLRPVLVERWPNRSDVREVADCLPALV